MRFFRLVRKTGSLLDINALDSLRKLERKITDDKDEPPIYRADDWTGAEYGDSYILRFY